MRKRFRAAVLSFFIPGAGQFYRKRYLSGIFFIVVFPLVVYFFKIIWNGFHPLCFLVMFSIIILWVGNIIDAFKGPYYPPAPCDDYCPAGVRPSLYISLLSEGKTEEAFMKILDEIIFPGSLGRICFAPCEFPCSRSGIDESIRIRYLKRFIFDNISMEHFLPREIEDNGMVVAIIGGGVSGIVCGYRLRKMGYRVVIFEREGFAGGMLTQSVPNYRLPKRVVEKEISFVKAIGVEVRTGIEVGRDIGFSRIKDDFDAIFIATGSHLNNQLSIGEVEKDSIYYGLDFLKMIKRGFFPSIGKKTIVIGGGSVAVDAARSAIRLGSEVTLISLESREEMPAYKEEIERAINEGVKIMNSLGVCEILGEKEIKGVQLKRCLTVFDNKGQVRPSFDESIARVEECETLIISIGQKADVGFLPDEIIDADGKVIVDFALRTPIPGVFAGGDLLGPSTAVEAVADGKKAAYSIDIYLRGFRARFSKFLHFTEYPIHELPLVRNPTPEPSLQIPQSGNNKVFEEIEGKCSFEEGLKESRRCLFCHLRFR